MVCSKYKWKLHNSLLLDVSDSVCYEKEIVKTEKSEQVQIQFVSIRIDRDSTQKTFCWVLCDKIVPLSVCSLNICRFSRLLIPVADLMFTLSGKSKNPGLNNFLGRKVPQAKLVRLLERLFIQNVIEYELSSALVPNIKRMNGSCKLC